MSAPSKRRPAASRSNAYSSSAMLPSLPLPALQTVHLPAVALGRAPLAPLAADRLDELALLGELLAGRAALLRLLVQLRRLGRAHAPRHRPAHDHLGAHRAHAQLHAVARVHLPGRLGRLPVDLHAPRL